MDGEHRMKTIVLLVLILFIVIAGILGRGPSPHVNGQGAGRPKPSPKPGSTAGRTTGSARQRPTAPHIEMVLIPAGSFTMGSPRSDKGRSYEEDPQHQVTVASFYLGRYEVTQAQWRAVMGENPSRFRGDDRPVDGVSWNDAVQFCQRLSQITGRQYRLPTEAEWEYACRAGTTTPFAFGTSLSTDQATFDPNFPDGNKQTSRVGTFQPNDFGLYDMHGNVREWCEDIHHNNYRGAPTDGSAWLSGDSNLRVSRGGAWRLPASSLRCAARDSSLPDLSISQYGIRVAASSGSQ